MWAFSWGDESEKEAVFSGVLENLLSTQHLTAIYILQISFPLYWILWNPGMSHIQAGIRKHRETLSTKNSACQIDCVMMEYSNTSPCRNVRICISNSRLFCFLKASIILLSRNKQTTDLHGWIDVFHKCRYNDDKYYSQKSVCLQQDPLPGIRNPPPSLKPQCVEVIRGHFRLSGSSVASHHLSHKTLVEHRDTNTDTPADLTSVPSARCSEQQIAVICFFSPWRIVSCGLVQRGRIKLAKKFSHQPTNMQPFVYIYIFFKVTVLMSFSLSHCLSSVLNLHWLFWIYRKKCRIFPVAEHKYLEQHEVPNDG